MAREIEKALTLPSTSSTKSEYGLLSEFIHQCALRLIKHLNKAHTFTRVTFLERMTEDRYAPMFKNNEIVSKVEKKFDEFHDLRKENDKITRYDLIDDRFISEISTLAEQDIEEFKLHENIELISNLLDLTFEESLLFQFGWAIDRLPIAAGLVTADLTNLFQAKTYDVYSYVFDKSSRKFRDIFERKLPLFQYGIMHLGESHNAIVETSPFIDDILVIEDLTVKKLEDYLFPSNLSTELQLDYYENQQDIEIIRKLIDNWFETRERGINVLLYGLPGTGKTELVLLMAQEFNWNLKIVGDLNDDDDDEKERNQRLFFLKLAQKFYSNTDTVLLLDEMEDIFKEQEKSSHSKVFLNRLIEQTKIPIFWTTNRITQLDQSTIRRMSFDMKFDVPSVSHRKKIWNVYAKHYDLGISNDRIRLLARNFDVVPALINNAAKIGSLTDAGDEDIVEILKSLDTAMNFGFERDIDLDEQQREHFDPEITNSDLNLNLLTTRLQNANTKAFSLCLYGPPGTGKSAYAKYIADRLELPVLHKRASDVMSMWVGQTEKNIKEAFQEARDEKMMLIFDEADSFLGSRKGANQSWEISQVNEMLTQMEKAQHPFVCTTNLMSNLDEASLRRFTFKMKFDFMTQTQVRQAFQLFFKDECPDFLARYQNLTPGDFAVILKKVDILGITNSYEIAEMVEQEINMKSDQPRPIGF